MENRIVTSLSIVLALSFGISIFHYGPYEGVLRIFYGAEQLLELLERSILEWISVVYMS